MADVDIRRPLRWISRLAVRACSHPNGAAYRLGTKYARGLRDAVADACLLVLQPYRIRRWTSAVAMLMELNFSRNAAIRALRNGGGDTEQAGQWLFAHAEDPGTCAVLCRSLASLLTPMCVCVCVCVCVCACVCVCVCAVI